jgi:hypothetical protein
MIAHFGIRDFKGRFKKGGRRVKIKYTGQHWWIKTKRLNNLKNL